MPEVPDGLFSEEELERRAAHCFYMAKVFSALSVGILVVLAVGLGWWLGRS